MVAARVEPAPWLAAPELILEVARELVEHVGRQVEDLVEDVAGSAAAPGKAGEVDRGPAAARAAPLGAPPPPEPSSLPSPGAGAAGSGAPPLPSPRPPEAEAPPARARELGGSAGLQSSCSAAGGSVPFGHTDGSYLGRFRSSLIPGWFGPSQETQLSASRMSVVVPPSSAGTPGAPVCGSRPVSNAPHGPVNTL